MLSLGNMDAACALVAGVVLVAGCGDIAPTSVTDGGDAGVSAEAALPDGADAADAADAAKTEGGTPGACVSPGGYRICRGPSNCSDSCCNDSRFASQTGNALSECPDALFGAFDTSHAGPYDDTLGCEGVFLQYLYDDPGLLCGPYEVGVLFAASGAGARVRYSDYSLWRDQPIPALAGACPAVPGVTLCGPGCGSCAANERCSGRSPLHPTGFCTDNSRPKFACRIDVGKPDCLVTDKCFNYIVEPSAQANADIFGYCMPASQCDALAAALPGIGKCTSP
ncbi:MAG TPA: hypothetical protein VF316_18785 [Polyangiaceae bacterium]